MPAHDTNITVQTRAGRRCASSGSKWEPIIGYSRAVRSGNIVEVTGTVGIYPDGTYPRTIEEQARRSLQIIQSAIEVLGGQLQHVIRTRMFVTDIKQWEEVAKAHGEMFSEIRPATTIVEVSRLIDDEAMIEIEADAVIPA